jgi:hypothetical protein
MTVIPFPDTRRAKVASQHLREAVILWLSVIRDRYGRDAFELAAEDLLTAIDAVLDDERAKQA